MSFAAFSLFAVTDRTIWVVVNQLKGTFGFALCGLAGLMCGRRDNTPWNAGMSGMTAGAMATIIYPLSIYLLAYGCLEWVKQYPFEYQSMIHSGMIDAREYLLSELSSRSGASNGVRDDGRADPNRACLGWLAGRAPFVSYGAVLFLGLCRYQRATR